MIKLVLATGNENKVKEFNDILNGYGIKVLSLNSLGLKMPNVKENGKTFKANALIKAKAVAKLTNYMVIADDSGLCIKSLHNFPGIHSSRFAKKCDGFSNANKLLVSKIKGSRRAYFVCSIALANWASKPITLQIKVDGTISREFKNDIGFGYDPIFIPDGFNKTYNQLSKKIKNQISHRALACKKLVELLKNKKVD